MANFAPPTSFRLTYGHVGNAAPTNEWSRLRTTEDAEAAAQKGLAGICRPAYQSTGAITLYDRLLRYRPFVSIYADLQGSNAWPYLRVAAARGIP
jgi:hypothetical protein